MIAARDWEPYCVGPLLKCGSYSRWGVDFNLISGYLGCGVEKSAKNLVFAVGLSPALEVLSVGICRLGVWGSWAFPAGISVIELACRGGFSSLPSPLLALDCWNEIIFLIVACIVVILELILLSFLLRWPCRG